MQTDEREPTGGAADEALSFEAARMRSAIEARIFHAEVVPVRIGRFVVIDVIGRGGMATVYRAYDPRLDRRVAVKVLHAGRGASMVRLEREAQALARLNHPNVVTIHEVGDAANGVFVAMELVEGGTLADWCRSRAPVGRQRWRKLVEFAVQACHGLAAAHRAGLVHRDLKPANILVGVDERVRVADFGLAAMDSARPEAPATVSDAPSVPQTLTVDGEAVGTVAYMAPEQLDGEADAKSDQFGLCAAFFEAFFGTRPYEGSTIAAMRESLAHGPKRPASSAAPDFVARALLRGLAPDPSRRFPDIDALRDALRDGARKRSIVLGAAVLAGGVAIATLAAARGQDCGFGTDELGDAWSDARRTELRDAFAASTSPAGAATLERVEAKIDRAAQSWASARVASCEAAQRSEPGADARLACLDVARTTFAELSAELTRGAEDLVVHAIDVADLLGDIVACDGESVADHATERGRELVALLQRGRVASRLTHFDDARPAFTAILGATTDGEFPRLRAEASTELTAIANLSGKWDLAAEHAIAALDDAERTSDPDFIARRWAMLAATLDNTGAPDEQLRFVFERARRHQSRGNDELVRADLDWKEAGYLQRRGRCAEAKPLFERAVATLAAHDSPMAPTALLQLGMCEVMVDTPSIGIATLERALAAAQARYAPDHPEVAAFYGALGDAHGFVLDEETAATFFERALAIYSAHPGFEGINHAGARLSLGISRTHLGREEEALADFRAAIEIMRELGRTTGPSVTDAWLGVASASRLLGRHDDALHACDVALAARDGPDPITEYEVAILRGKIFADAEMRDEASLAIADALARSRELHDPATAQGAGAAYALGDVLTRVGRPGEAIALLEAARTKLDPAEGALHVALRLQLARAALANGDPAAARSHTQEGNHLLTAGVKVKPDVRDGIAELAKQLPGAASDP